MKSAKKASDVKTVAAPEETVATKSEKTIAKKALKTSNGVKAEANAASKTAKAVAPAKKKAQLKAKSETRVKAKSKTKPVAKKMAEKHSEVETAKILDSKVVYQGPLFRVMHDRLIEPDGTESERDVIRHNGSVVILAVDYDKQKKHKKDPWVVIERQYRHAAGQYLWELPAGKLDAGEVALEGAKRELAEETGYAAKKWSPLVEYFASPGFLGEAMKVFLAEGLVAGEAHPEEDEHIDFRLVRLSELLQMADDGKIIDGKTLTTVLLYARLLGIKKKD